MRFPPRRPSQHMSYRPRQHLARCRSHPSIVFFKCLSEKSNQPHRQDFSCKFYKTTCQTLTHTVQSSQHLFKGLFAEFDIFSRELSEKITLFQGTFGHHWLLTNKLFTIANEIHGRWSRVLCKRFGTLSQSAQAAYPATCILLIYLPLSGYSAPPYKSENTSVSFIRHDGYLKAVCSVSVRDGGGGFWQG